MVFLQALFALLRRSLGSVLKAIFGWATLALFGEVRDDERNLLTAAVAAAAIWPFLVVGTVFPRQAAIFLVVVPVPKGTPEEIVRAVWIVCTILVPLGVGWAISRRNPTPSGAPRWRDILKGVPATLGIGIAFVIACVAVPAAKLAALARGRKDEHVALAIPPGRYGDTVERLTRAIHRAGIAVEQGRAPLASRWLERVLHVFAGKILGAYLPENVVYLRSDLVEMTFYPNGVRVSGIERLAARVHAVIVESATETPALQCMSADAQKIEKRLKALPRRPREEDTDDEDLAAVATELATSSLAYDDWQILYREMLQLLVERRDAAPLLRRAAARSPKPRPKKAAATHRPPRRRFGKRVRQAGTYGRRKLTSAAADRGFDVFERLVGRVLRAFARRR